MTRPDFITERDYRDHMGAVVEIVHDATGAIVACDTLAHLIASDDGLACDVADIVTALWRGEFYHIGGGAAAGFTLRPGPLSAQRFAAA